MTDRIATLAGDLLDAVEAAATEHGIALPARRYVHVGQVAFDCAQVVVALGPITRGRPNAEAPDVNRASDSISVELNVWLIREVPSLSHDGQHLPAVAALQAAGETLSADGWLLTIGMLGRYRTLAGGCTSLALGATFPAGPEGGYAGWRTVLTVAL